jgi:hypothetical protein
MLYWSGGAVLARGGAPPEPPGVIVTGLAAGCFPAAPESPAALAPPAVPSPLLDEPPSSEQLLAWSSLSPEVWP